MAGRSSLTEEFANALETHAERFEVPLPAPAVARLCDYYELLNAWNARLHLVAPCSPAEFATRHILESMLALPHLPHGARVADVGSGAGLPVIPCLIMRPDIRATLIESSPKKAVFLREALQRIDAQDAAQVIAKRFEKASTPDAEFITCRALDHFAAMFQKLVVWSPPASTLLLFGGHTIREQIERAGLPYTVVRIPESEQRYLFVAKRVDLSPPPSKTR